FEAPPGKPRLAVVVTGLGLDKDATEAAITKLPAEVTLAFSPYAGGLDKWIKKAREFGHEIVVMLPAEPVGFPARDPGPWGLLVANSVDENLSRMEQALARAPGAVGVLAPDGAFVRSDKLKPVLTALKDRGLIFLGDGARIDVDVPGALVTTTLDTDLFRDAIEARLNAAARAARDSGSGLVVVSPRPVAFDRLVGWLDRLGDQGVAVAPATGIVKQTGK
ncbi:MAG TPA: divergent polysaccharide deacetylase family protein, partial [Magnetospirillum sp.]|nr:divergent polysaccharide deacetylase family protein [Magnetospirillum sp.]